MAVQKYIGQVLRRKRALLDESFAADKDAREKRREADKAEARVFLRVSGSVDARKAQVDLDEEVDRLRGEADVAEAIVRHLRGLIFHCSDELDASRTAAATVRKEFEVSGLSSEDGA